MAILVPVATVAALVVVIWPAPPAMSPARAGSVYRICPVADCSRYPDPAHIRGITIATLQNWILYIRSAEAQIRATGAWHANAVRLQIIQDKMVGQGGGSFSAHYMAAVQIIARDALRHHLYVILNAQTEPSVGFAGNEPLPTYATTAFWLHMVNNYGHNPRVVFDLFNEPRNCTWAQWQAAFQPLVSTLRAHGALNQFWAEGDWWGSTLQGVPLLNGQGIVYSYHHPGSPWPFSSSRPQDRPVGIPTWNSAFGYLAARGVPVVDGEFVNYLGGYYWPHSTQMVTRYFEYLHYHHIGLVSWSLQPGIMTATSRLTSAVSEPTGAGRLIWRYYHNRLLFPPAVHGSRHPGTARRSATPAP